MRRHTRLGGVVLCLAAGVAASAVEPDGFTALRWSWPDAPPRAGSAATLVVTVRAVVPLEDVAVRIEAPEEAAVALEPEPSAMAPSARLVVGPLPAGAEARILLRVRAPAKGGGVLAVRAEGRVAGGATFVEGCGVAVGTPGTEPVRRHGALEFPAARGSRTP